MSPSRIIALLVGPTLVVACASNPDRQTLVELHDVPADVEEVAIDDSLEMAMQSYRRYLEETPASRMTPEAMRRLADLQIEREFGIIGSGRIVEVDPSKVPEFREIAAPSEYFADPVELPPPSDSGIGQDIAERAAARSRNTGGLVDLTESDQEFESRTTGELAFDGSDELVLPTGEAAPTPAGPLEAIRLYQRILEEYPSYERSDQVLYQMARAYDEIGQPDEAMAVMETLIGRFGYSRYLDEVYFRRGEYLFTRRQFRAAEDAYGSIISMGPTSSYYELALYKLGWSLYKQEFYEEALHRFTALLDYKLSTGYDFDQAAEEDGERRVADTFRVISLSFSNLGGPEVVSEYFASFGNRSFEDRIYANLGEFYLSKLRYHDSAAVYQSFVELYPYHRVAPRFSMRVVDIYGEGGFPLLVVEAKKEFATLYGLSADYWQYFDVNESPEVLGFLKTNLTDLANHYHSLYQAEGLEEEQPENFAEASRWYREFLQSFPAAPETPGVNYQLAGLLLEHEDFGPAALEYERTAYEYEPHEQAAAAGYAAIFAHRQNLERASEPTRIAAQRDTVASSLRFADTFPDHEHAATVLGGAVDDLYKLDEHAAAVESGRKLIERYPGADPALLRSTWTIVAHSSFELDAFADAEHAYSRVLDFVPEDDEARPGLIDNLAASIYQQGELANAAEDYRTAANHFLRIKDVAPESEIRASAEYDAASALIRLEDWTMAGNVLEAFRASFPEHELQQEATQQLASVYRRGGALDKAAAEYERVAAESDDPELRGDAMLLAGELYEDVAMTEAALDVYRRYVDEFPRPLDMAQETRSKMSELFETNGRSAEHRAMLREIVEADATAGLDRTDRSRFLAAQGALELSDEPFASFVAIKLVQPFDRSLAEKQRRMNEALEVFDRLIAYEVGEVTAAATYYIAEIYYDFSQSLLDSERPAGLIGNDLVDYELALEEEAYPFEEQAIEIHERNFELVTAGVFNPWVQRSLDKLATLVPGRYAKSEISSGFMGALDGYAYRSPNAPTIEGGDGLPGEAAAPTAALPLDTGAASVAGVTLSQTEGGEVSHARAE